MVRPFQELVKDLGSKDKAKAIPSAALVHQWVQKFAELSFSAEPPLAISMRGNSVHFQRSGSGLNQGHPSWRINASESGVTIIGGRINAYEVPSQSLTLPLNGRVVIQCGYTVTLGVAPGGYNVTLAELAYAAITLGGTRSAPTLLSFDPADIGDYRIFSALDYIPLYTFRDGVMTREFRGGNFNARCHRNDGTLIATTQ